MNNIEKSPITTLYKDIKSSAEVRTLLPMGYVPTLPIITVKNEQLIAMVPFLRYKLTGEKDRTLIYPIRFVIEYLIPEKQVVGFKDLSIEESYPYLDFDSVIGFFRHDAIKHLCKDEYDELRKRILAEYDKMVMSLIEDTVAFTYEEEEHLRKDLQTIIEPSVYKTYELLDQDFYKKFLNK